MFDMPTTFPDVATMRKDGEINPDADLEFGVLFSPVLPDGKVLDSAEKLYRFTVFHYGADGQRIAASPRPGFNEKLLDLF